MIDAEFIPLPGYREYPVDEMRQRAQEFYREVNRRRTVRQFSTRKPPLDIILECVHAAGTAPNGANKQPWHFVVVSDPLKKSEIRQAAEIEEREFYERRASQEWLEDLLPFRTNANKPYLEIAPYLIAIFVRSYEVLPDGTREKLYYTHESVGIATGILIAALHTAGLTSLTHTPSPMAFLNPILNRPPNEHPFLLLVVGYPAEDAQVPNIHRKELDEIVSIFQEEEGLSPSVT